MIEIRKRGIKRILSDMICGIRLCIAFLTLSFSNMLTLFPNQIDLDFVCFPPQCYCFAKRICNQLCRFNFKFQVNYWDEGSLDFCFFSFKPLEYTMLRRILDVRSCSKITHIILRGINIIRLISNLSFDME